MNIRTLGIVGIGRLGKALTAILNQRFRVLVYDQNVKMAKQYAKQTDCAFFPLNELLERADAVLLCVPAHEVEGLLEGPVKAKGFAGLVVNMATGKATDELPQPLTGKLLGAKMLGQFRAIEAGIPTTIVSGTQDENELVLLKNIFFELGTIVSGEERLVSTLNRLATKQVIEMAIRFNEQADTLNIEEAWKLAALKSVMVGTLLDFPLDRRNPYLQNILEELELSGSTCGEGV